jgi:hypothetical protein
MGRHAGKAPGVPPRASRRATNSPDAVSSSGRSETAFAIPCEPATAACKACEGHPSDAATEARARPPRASASPSLPRALRQRFIATPSRSVGPARDVPTPRGRRLRDTLIGDLPAYRPPVPGSCSRSCCSQPCATGGRKNRVSRCAASARRCCSAASGSGLASPRCCATASLHLHGQDGETPGRRGHAKDHRRRPCHADTVGSHQCRV